LRRFFSIKRRLAYFLKTAAKPEKLAFTV
jgi:hypothetical protein